MVSALKTAKSWGRSPLSVLAGRPERWTTDDTILAMAFDAYQATRVDQFGFPRRRSEEGDPEGYFEVREGFNAAKQAHDLWSEDHKDSDPEAGTYTYLVDTRLE